MVFGHACKVGVPFLVETVCGATFRQGEDSDAYNDEREEEEGEQDEGDCEVAPDSQKQPSATQKEARAVDDAKQQPPAKPRDLETRSASPSSALSPLSFKSASTGASAELSVTGLPSSGFSGPCKFLTCFRCFHSSINGIHQESAGSCPPEIAGAIWCNYNEGFSI